MIQSDFVIWAIILVFYDDYQSVVIYLSFG